MTSARLTLCSFDVIHDEDPFQSPYDGPYQVVHPGDKTFQLLIGGRQATVSINRLKPAHLDIDSPVQVAQPPNRGRPR
ncbi:Hypothetical predicted protein [Octopus vulgaris]|uniref:Uncharacterized protein n=1 Tax=Octopus vulgaris TaxID=6645 RepID=A0AA36AT94_OCTVU|nr:Hypothetical predicted protein [Octopus vulgaris]